jgi:hypothetical protein
MLHCNMGSQIPPSLGLAFDDVLGSLQYARRIGDLGRLAHVTYWEVRKWARWAHRDALAERAADLVKGQPQPSRAAFLAIVDDVISEMERIRAEESTCEGSNGGVKDWKSGLVHSSSTGGPGVLV